MQRQPRGGKHEGSTSGACMKCFAQSQRAEQHLGLCGMLMGGDWLTVLYNPRNPLVCRS